MNRASGALFNELAELGVDEDVAAARELDLLEEGIVAGVADLDAVKAGADALAVALPVRALADQYVIDPQRRVGDVAFDADGDGVGVQRVRAGNNRQPEQRHGQYETIERLFHGALPPAAGAASRR